METDLQPLLKEYQLGDIKLKNRIVMAPMTRSRANNKYKAPTDLHVEYYSQRAGAGLIISEGSQVSERAVGYVNTPGIYTEKQVKAWKKVTDAVHQKNGKIFIQLWHCGRISHPKFHAGEKPLAPSAVNPHKNVYTPEGFEQTTDPKAMSIQDIKATIQEFKHAAKCAKEAGFDGVEIHSSNGYLFHQFFNKNSNLRNDDYGESIPNRARFFFEVVDAIAEVWPENRIGCRFNPSMHNLSGIRATDETIATFDYITNKLNNYKLAYVHLSEPFNDISNIKYLEPHIAKHYRPIYKGTLIIGTNFTMKKGNKVIADGDADLVSFGKPFISNPDLPERFKNNWPLADWDQDTFYTSGEKGYTDYPSYKQVKNS